MRKTLSQLFLMFAAALAGLFILLLLNIPQTNLAPEDGKALVGGSIESGYEFVGFLISESNEVCSATLIDEKTILTAAHCLNGTIAENYYFGVNQFSLDKNKLSRIQKIFFSPSFDAKTGKGIDIALAELENEIVLADYAQLGSTEEQCDARIVGYGSGIVAATTAEYFQKKSGFGCVRGVSQNFVYQLDQATGICFGDSGSPILDSSNNVIGVLSRGIVDSNFNENLCLTGNTALAVATNTIITSELSKSNNILLPNGNIQADLATNFELPKTTSSNESTFATGEASAESNFTLQNSDLTNLLLFVLGTLTMLSLSGFIYFFKE